MTTLGVRFRNNYINKNRKTKEILEA